MKYTVFIFARGGSKGLKNKNIKLIHNKPLIVWTINFAKNLKDVKEIIVSTDDEKISAIAKKNGAKVPFLRPKYLSSDTSPEWLAWKHAIKWYFKEKGKLPDPFISMPVTSPLRTKSDFDKCIDLFYSSKKDAVITITEPNRNPYFNMVKENDNGDLKIVNQSQKYNRRQDAPKVYDITTLFYILKPKLVLSKNHIFDCKVSGVKIPRERSLDIDNKFDFEFAEFLLKKKFND